MEFYSNEPLINGESDFLLEYWTFKKDHPKYKKGDGNLNDYYQWLNAQEKKLTKLFQDQEIALKNTEEYYFGCPFSIYKKHYENRKKDFLNQFEDATEIDFIIYELRNGIFELPPTYEYILSKQKVKFGFALKKRFEFLESEANDLGYTLEYIESDPMNSESFKLKSFNKSSTPNISTLKWNGSQTELIELIKALILSEKIQGTQKGIINSFSTLFEIEIKNPDKIIQDIKNRNNGSETLFLDHLKKLLLDYIKR